MDNSLFIALIGIFGVFVGALLGGIGFLIRSRVENIRIINEALFNLLGIWRILKIAEPSSLQIIQLPTSFLEKIKEKFPQTKITDEDKATAERMLIALLEDLLNKEFYSQSKSLFTSFNSSVNNLARIDPVFAYELGANRHLAELLGQIDTYLRLLEKKAEDEGIIDLKNQEINATFSEASRRYITADILKEFEKDIRRLARKSSFLAWFRCKIKMRKTKRRDKDIAKYFEAEIGKYFDEFVIPLLVKT